MKIATITALFPPTVIGGAEVSASNLAWRLSQRGHDVSVLSTTVDSRQKEVQREIFRDTVNVWRFPMPRSYTAYNYANHSQFVKLAWHAQDHFDPRNRAVWSKFLDETEPDFAFVHVSQGLGYNGLSELGRRDIPTIMILHDLSLACYKTSMFVNGKTCEGQCMPCLASSRVKFNYLKGIPRLGFVSPSRSNYETVRRHVPIGAYPSRIILNANGYDAPAEVKPESGALRLVYAGQISKSKGVEFLLDVVAGLTDRHDISIRVVGGGPELENLKAKYGDRDWVEFTGKVTQSQVSSYMAQGDVLCTPSLWPDNSPGVIIQAITCGLPVLGSDKGGIPELIDEDVTGAVLAPGDKAAWSAMLSALANDKGRVARWAHNAREAAKDFDPESSVTKYLAFAATIANGEASIEAA